MSKAIKEYAYYCFEVLDKYLENKGNKARYYDDDITNFDGAATILGQRIGNDSYPLFVTWNLVDEDGDEELRGCIGNFGGLPLREGLKEYALISALQDTRFEPVSRSELKFLSCSVSLLVEFEDARNYLDWTIGIHGIRIKLSHKGSIYSATYLPEIAEEQGWNKEQTIRSLLRKGGFRGTCSQEILDNIKLRRYQSHKVKATYDEYLDYIKANGI